MLQIVKDLLKRSPVPLTRNHRYDQQTRRIISSLPPGANCVDVGCYRGEILDLMLAAAPAGRHLGVEPIPAQYAFLRERYAGKEAVEIANVAASDAAGEADFNYVTSNPPYSGLRRRAYDRPGEQDTSITVRTERLDALVPEDRHVDLVKIDVEGAELQVLRGAERILRAYRPTVVFEHGLGAADKYGTTPEQVFDLFAGHGMQVGTLSDFLGERVGLSRDAFGEQFRQGRNYYFAAFAKT